MSLSQSFQKRAARRPHLLSGAHGIPAEVRDLSDDVDVALQQLENMVGLPQIHEVVSNRAHQGDASKNAITPMEGISDTEDTILTLTGVNLDAGLGYDSYLHDGAAANTQIRFTALRPGDSKLKVALTAGLAEAVAVASSADSDGDTVITFTYIATTSTPGSLRTLLQAEANTAAGRLICIDFDAETGAGTLVADDALTATALTGHTGTRQGAAPIVRLRGLVGDFKSCITASAYAANDTQPSSPELKVFFDPADATNVGAWESLLVAGTVGRKLMVDVVIDGYQMSFPLVVVDSAA